jgi:hypothetical protein
LNVRDDGHSEDCADGDFDVPTVPVIGDARTCRLDCGTSAPGDHCRAGLVPYYSTGHCKLAAMDSSMPVVEVI